MKKRFERHRKSYRIGLVFGREDRGLENDEILLCDYHVELRVHPENGSLNLSSAVLLACYECYNAVYKNITHSTSLMIPDQKEKVSDLMDSILEKLDYYGKDSPELTGNYIKTILGKAHLNKREGDWLEKFLYHVKRKLHNFE